MMQRKMETSYMQNLEQSRFAVTNSDDDMGNAESGDADQGSRTGGAIRVNMRHSAWKGNKQLSM